MTYKSACILGWLWALAPIAITAQWSTSTYAESSLYVCPGFLPGMITFDDGSSIILGALQSYIFAQKLDPYGYKVWAQPVEVLYNDSSNIPLGAVASSWGGWVSDGDGGVIVSWYDLRGAYMDSTGDYKNSAIYAQRVDKDGVIRWASGGVKIKGPETGWKEGGIVADGQGGFVIAWTDGGFDYPGAPHRSMLYAARYDQRADRVWETSIDSSYNYWFSFNGLFRGGKRLYEYYCGSGSNNFLRIIDTSGNIITSSNEPPFGINTEKDSVAYAIVDTAIYKFGSMGDTIWSTPFNRPSNCEYNDFFVPDGYGGAYFLVACGDTIFHFDFLGVASRQVFFGINYSGIRAFPDGGHGIVATNDDTAKRFDQSGQMVWPRPVVYLQDLGNAYFRLYEPDNNGGVIVAFWTTWGGIFAQHSGRYGKIGTISSVNGTNISPDRFNLNQNYPNPFNPSTTITFTLSHRGHVQMEIFDLLGRNIKSLLDEVREAGKYKVTFDGSRLSSGVYFYRLSTGNEQAIKRMMLLH